MHLTIGVLPKAFSDVLIVVVHCHGSSLSLMGKSFVSGVQRSSLDTVSFLFLRDM